MPVATKSIPIALDTIADQAKGEEGGAFMRALLSRNELRALRDFARAQVLQSAELCVEQPAWRRPDDPPIAERREWAFSQAAARGDGDPERAKAAVVERQSLAGAADVYGLLVAAQRGFEEASGQPAPEWVEVEFTPRASAWLGEQWAELRASLEARRGSIGIGWSSTKRDCFVLFVLDGIVAAGGGR